MSLIIKDKYTDLLGEAAIPVFEEHKKEYIEWMPHEWVPWELGKNFALLDGHDFDPAESQLDPELLAAVVILLFHKDQLPSYHRILTQKAPIGTHMFEWINRWTAEEAAHAVPLRDYLVVTRATDPTVLESRRLQAVMTGYLQRSDTFRFSSIESVIMISLLEAISIELALKISNRTDDVALKAITELIARDDTLHLKSFTKLIKAALNADYDHVSQSILRLVAAATPLGEDWGEGYPETELIAREIYTPEDHRKVIDNFLISLGLGQN